MTRQLLASAAVVALIATMGGTGSAFAQDAGGGTQAPTGQTPAQKLPEVQVVQPQQKAKPKPIKKASKPKATPSASAAVTAPSAESPEGAEATAAGMQYAEPPESNTVKMSPLSGSEIPVEKVPGSVYQMNSSAIKRDGSVILQDALQTQIPGVIISDLQGNQFQTDIQFRGFEASPVNGVAQGLAVYQNGVRINEAFGDIVNWDFLPSNAINNVAVVVGDPVFGLNALGGAVVVDMKDGFNFHGADIDTRFGSFGRKQVSAEAGYQSGNWAAYGAFEAINDDGFRDFSDAEVRRGYFDLGVKGDNAEFHFNFTGADNNVGVTAAAPEALLDISRSLTFTSPQTTENIMQMYSVNGKVRATEDITLSGNAYYRHFKQDHVDGNLFDDPGDCGGADAGTLCSGDEQVLGNGAPVQIGGGTNFPTGTAFGSIDQTSQNADSGGLTLQAVDKAKLFNHNNQFIIGTSYDHGVVSYSAFSELGTFGPKYVVNGDGIVLSGTDDFDPKQLRTTNDYFGAYILDNFDITDRLSLTVGGRFNWAQIQIQNTSGDEDDDTLNGKHIYARFNPNAGLTYKFSNALNWYGGYSEANRAPVAAELACADPENPCLIESFLTADPALKQVVSNTWETGFRGTIDNWQNHSQWNWGVGFFHTTNYNDIFDITETDIGHGFFQNFGTTLRQGVEANISYRSQRLFWYANYTFTDATFQSNGIFPSPNHPDGGTIPCEDEEEGATTCLAVHKGDRLPGIPAHTFKAGFDYWVTPKWKVGSDVIAASDQIFFGDENNTARPLSGYAKVNLHTSYDVTDNIQVYGLFENLFDRDYALYGTYYSTDDAEGDPPDFPGPNTPAGRNLGDNPRTVVPAIPFAAYGGVKVKF